MCGIAGIYNLNNDPVSLKTLKRFTDAMDHRGPDGAGYELLNNGSLGLGHRRLSILDLTDAGKQPMSYTNGRYWITYNGEVFNFQEIKNELKIKGYSFNSESDTEVILASYIEWGKDCLHKFNGMWAFAIWDEQEKELFLARDRFGIKPLYYTYIKPDRKFIFASETRAFKFLDGYYREIDEELLKINLQDNYALEGLGYTPFKEIYQILPGHYLLFNEEQGIKQKRWWHIDDHLHNDIPESLNEQAEEFYQLFKDACRIRLISDVPVATALSGGLDSSSVYSMVNDILKNENNRRVNKDSQRAFSAVFPGLPNDEKEYAELAASYVGGKIDYIETDYNNLGDQIAKDSELCDFISTSPITSIAAVYKGMRKAGVKVSLDGHGVDEMMYGYRDMVYSLYNNALWLGSLVDTKKHAEVIANMYHHNDMKTQIDKFKNQIDEKLDRETNLLFKIKKRIKPIKEENIFNPIELPSLSDKPYDFTNKSLPQRMVYYEFFQHTLPALLRNFDRASMMNSVEIRMPFMDWRLVTYVFSLPIKSKIGQGFTKLILRESMKGRMNENIRTRTFKVGLSSPVDYWFNKNLQEWVLNRIQNKEELNSLTNAYKIGELSRMQVRETWLKINTQLIN